MLVDIADQPGGGAILTLGGDLSFDQRLERLGQFLAQFHAPLIERVNAEDHPLDKDAMLIKRDDLAQREGIERFLGQRG